MGTVFSTCLTHHRHGAQHVETDAAPHRADVRADRYIFYMANVMKLGQMAQGWRGWLADGNGKRRSAVGGCPKRSKAFNIKFSNNLTFAPQQ